MEETTQPNNSDPKEKPYQRYRRLHPERVKEQERLRSQKRTEYFYEWRENNPEYRSQYREKHREEERGHSQKYSRKRRLQLRMQIIEFLGGKCVRCGFRDWRGLQVDHINGGGNKERKQAVSMDRYYRDMLKWPEKYQILCANCNQIKRYREEEWGNSYL